MLGKEDFARILDCEEAAWRYTEQLGANTPEACHQAYAIIERLRERLKELPA